MVFWLFMTVFLQKMFFFLFPQHAVKVCTDILEVHTFFILRVPESSSGESYSNWLASNSMGGISFKRMFANQKCGMGETGYTKPNRISQFQG